MNREDVKSISLKLQDLLNADGIKITRSKWLEYFSKALGYADWNTASAALGSQVSVHSESRQSEAASDIPALKNSDQVFVDRDNLLGAVELLINGDYGFSHDEVEKAADMLLTRIRKTCYGITSIDPVLIYRGIFALPSNLSYHNMPDGIRLNLYGRLTSPDVGRIYEENVAELSGARVSNLLKKVA